MTIRIRDARVEDAPFLAQTDLIATRSHVNWGFMDLALERTDDFRLSVIQTMIGAEPRSYYHHSRFLVAETDGQPAAALCGYTEEPQVHERLFPAIEIARLAHGVSNEEFAAGQERLAPLATCPYPGAPGEWVVEWVGTLPEFRRRGAVGALLEAILERGRSTGHTSAHIAVLIGNDTAQHSYEKAGFAAYEDVCHPDFERVMRAPGMRKLRSPL